MGRISDYRLREYVEGLDLEPSELVDMLEISVLDLLNKFPHKVRANSDKFGVEDMSTFDEEN